jgi:cell division protease FtsH
MKLAETVRKKLAGAPGKVAPAAKAIGAYVRALPRAITALALLVMILFVSYFVLLAKIAPVSPGDPMTLDRLESARAHGLVLAATFHDEDSRVTLVTKDGALYWAAYPHSDAQTGSLIDSMIRSKVRVEIDQQAGKSRLRFIAQFLMPLVILAALFGLFFLIMSGKGGAAEFTAFSKFTKGTSNMANGLTFADVAAAKEAKIELQEVVDYLKDPSKFAALGALAPKGVLLSGPPGTGKTLLARAVAGEAGVPFFSLSGSEFVESLVGVGAARVRDLFKQARESAPAIIFIDELDAAGRQRGAGMGQGNDEREQTLNQLLVEMDGFSVSSGIVVMGATNRPDILDPALMRPGRFDRQVVVDAPDAEGRAEILGLYATKRPLDGEVDLMRLAKQCPGFTGADLSNLVNEAALLAVRGARPAITMDDLEEAIDRVIAGPERRSHVLTPDEKRLVAYHEAGHAVVAAGIGMGTGVQKLSIVARGRSLGHTTTYSISDRLVLSRSDLERQLATTMGGAAVEQMVFGETTTGSEGDLRSATSVARAMVATFGMGEALGRVAVGQKSGEVFLGRDFTQMQNISPATLEAVDGEVRTLLDAAEAKATAILRANRTIVEAIVAHLLEHETFSGSALDALLATVRIPGARVAAASNGHKRARLRV